MNNISITRNKVQHLLLVWSFPVLVYIMQIANPVAVLIGGLILLICAILFPSSREILLTFSFAIIGHLFWLYTSEYIVNNISLSPFLIKIVNRFGLIGYLALFAVWYCIQKPQNRFIRVGDGKTIIRFPFIWKGIKEIEWRFTLIFSMICLGVTVFFAFTTELSYSFILYGILFSVVNALLEEFIWRGFILTRLLDISNEKTALIVSALAFGLYHISLQFPIWVCLIFAIGGFYIGGSTIKSRGLLSPIIMHVMVNLVFVFSGIIF